MAAFYPMEPGPYVSPGFCFNRITDFVCFMMVPEPESLTKVREGSEFINGGGS